MSKNESLETIKKMLPQNISAETFMEIFSTLLKDSTANNQILNNNYTNFNGQPFELYCGNYICSETEIYFFNNFGQKIVVCSHPIIISKRFMNITSGECKVELQFKRDGYWKNIIVNKSIIASSTNIITLADYGIAVTSENAKFLIKYLAFLEANNTDILKQYNSVSSLGWVNEREFCPFAKKYTLDNEDSFRSLYQSITESGDYVKWLDAILKVREEKTEARIFLAASFASILIKPFNMLPFFVHSWGMSGSGKTVMLMLAASVWANPALGNYITTFNATNVGQEVIASFLNNLPMCIDELQIKASIGQTKFDETIYSLCEGVGRARATKSIGLRNQYRWSNCFLSTGEFPIINNFSGNGSINRVIEFECSQKIYSNLIELVEVLTNNYGFAGRKFVEYVQKEGSLAEIKALQKDFYMQLTERNVTEKQAASAALLLATDKIVTELLFNDNNALTIDEIEAITIKNTNLDTYGKALEYIYQLVARNPLHFLSEYTSECKLEVWGKIETDYIYIIKSAFDEQLQKIGINPEAFLSWAKKKNLIKINKNRRTFRKSINGSLIYTIALQKPETESAEETETENFELPF